MPAAAPWITRAMVSTVSLGAIPPRTEPAANRTSAAIMLRRWPNARLAQSASSMVAVMAARKPVEIHCASTWLMPKVPITPGIATLTIVVESTTATAATITVPVASHR